MTFRIRIRYQTSQNGVRAILRVQGRALPPTAEVNKKWRGTRHPNLCEVRIAARRRSQMLAWVL